jgi:DNA-directed RNA polymerase subunit RPC12/RpoP
MTPAALICAACGTELQASNKFCHECGARITLPSKPAEYKQVTARTAGPCPRRRDRVPRLSGSIPHNGEIAEV